VVGDARLPCRRQILSRSRNQWKLAQDWRREMPFLEAKELLDPAAWIDFAVKAFAAWRGFRVLVLGTTQVGKTTLWKALETGRAVQASEVEKTLAIAKVAEGKWKEALDAVRPQGPCVHDGSPGQPERNVFQGRL
jgi:hypothetical protein